MDQTPRFALPMLAAGQAQKEMTHNEAVQKIELLLCPSVAGGAANAPPTTPVAGSSYLVGSAPTGAWTGHAHALAGWSAGGWRFIEATEGLRVRLASNDQEAVFRGGAWQVGIVEAAQLRIAGEVVVSARRPAIPAPSGGTTNDSEARVAIGAMLAALRAHGLIAT